MRASSARLLHTTVRLADITFPTTGTLLSRTRLAFIHLDNLISFAKGDRDGRVDAYVVGYFPDELVLLFFKQGEVVNAACMRSDARVVLPIAEALRRLKAEEERGEILYAAAPAEQLDLMFAACAGPARPRPVESREPASLFRGLASAGFTGAIELISEGRVSYLKAREGRFVAGWFYDKPEGMSVAEYVQSLFRLLPSGTLPVIAAADVPDLGPLPTQAPPAQVRMYRELLLRLGEAAEAEMPGQGQRKSDRVRASLLPEHPMLGFLATGEEEAVSAVTVPAERLTEGLAAWATQLMEEVEVVSPGSAVRLLREATREQRFVLQAAGFYDRLPWEVTW